MSGSPLTGIVTATANDIEYRLFFGTTAIAEVQADYGADFLATLDKAAEQGGNELPVALLNAIIAAALRRHHADDLRADPYLVDDLILQNSDILGDLIAVAFGKRDSKDAPQGNRSKAGARRKAA